MGPTAVGKTALAVRLCRATDGEVVSADSRQVYRRMDIGTAKPTPQERALVPHHLVDVVEPDRTLTLAEYQERAYEAIEDILSRGKLPYLVGGTGLYVRAVLEGLQIPAVPPDPAFRAALAERQPQELHQELARLDPAAAARIHPRNVRRVIRALEVVRASGRPFSAQRRRRQPPYRKLVLGLALERPALYRRIDERVERMLSAGLVEEVRGLLEAGYGPQLPSMSALGYRQMVTYLEGRMSLEEAVQALRRDTRRFVRQQSGWFRRDDPRIHWLEAADDPYPPALCRVKLHLP